MGAALGTNAFSDKASSRIPPSSHHSIRQSLTVENSALMTKVQGHAEHGVIARRLAVCMGRHGIACVDVTDS